MKLSKCKSDKSTIRTYLTNSGLGSHAQHFRGMGAVSAIYEWLGFVDILTFNPHPNPLPEREREQTLLSPPGRVSQIVTGIQEV